MHPKNSDIKMPAPLLLRTFVKERLTAAAEEIFQVFERTIEKYEEEASSSKQEIERLRGLLLEFVSNHKTDLCQSSICKEETPPEQHLQEQGPSLGVDRRDPEPRHIKEEDQDFWPSQQQQEEEEEEEEEEPAREFQEADAVYLPHPPVWEKRELEDAEPSLQPQTHNSGSERWFHEMQETKPTESQSPLTQIQSERICDGGESDRPAVTVLSKQTRPEQNQTSIISYRDSTQISHLNSAVPDYRCHQCEKSFSSNHHLINHAFRFHSKDAGLLCAVCGKSLESSESLNAHLKSHKGSKCCDMCGKHCNSTTALAEHMASHTGVKLHRCHVCGKECSRKGDLKIHMRIHTGEKPFCCSFCCKSFTHSGHLRKHMRSHTGERPHRCDLCGKGFLQSAHLKYHLRTHTQKY